MAAQLTDITYAERQGIGGKITIGAIVALSVTWFDYVIGNTSINATETQETIDLQNGISTELIYKGITYKRFDLIDDSQSFILSTTNQIITKRY